MRIRTFHTAEASAQLELLQSRIFSVAYGLYNNSIEYDLKVTP